MDKSYGTEAWHEEHAYGYSERVTFITEAFLNWRLFTWQLSINMLMKSVQEVYTGSLGKFATLNMPGFSVFRGSTP